MGMTSDNKKARLLDEGRLAGTHISATMLIILPLIAQAVLFFNRY
jgi:hypothetical protein